MSDLHYACRRRVKNPGFVPSVVMSSEVLVGEHFPNDEPLDNWIHLEAMQGAS